MPTQRAVQREDVDLLLDLQVRHQQAVLGRPDTTRADVEEMLADPDLLGGTVVVEDGRALGAALVWLHGDQPVADLEVVVDPGPGAHLAAGLLRDALDATAAAARQRGHRTVRVDQGCYRDDAAFRQVLAGQGLAVGTVFTRLRRDLAAAVEPVPPAAGVRVEQVAEDDAGLRRAHALHTSTFAAHYAFVARAYDDWLAAHRARAVDGALWVATVDGRDAGFLQETDQFVEDEASGYVARLGVESWARGRGLGRALLLSAFAAMRERGRAAALLHVDSAGNAPALGLYTSVGMTPVVVIDAWTRTLPTSG